MFITQNWEGETRKDWWIFFHSQNYTPKICQYTDRFAIIMPTSNVNERSHLPHNKLIGSQVPHHRRALTTYIYNNGPEINDGERYWDMIEQASYIYGLIGEKKTKIKELLTGN